MCTPTDLAALAHLRDLGGDAVRIAVEGEGGGHPIGAMEHITGVGVPGVIPSIIVVIPAGAPVVVVLAHGAGIEGDGPAVVGAAVVEGDVVLQVRVTEVDAGVKDGNVDALPGVPLGPGLWRADQVAAVPVLGAFWPVRSRDSLWDLRSSFSAGLLELRCLCAQLLNLRPQLLAINFLRAR